MKKFVFGCGYLGKRVAVAWAKQGHEVYAMTRSEDHREEWDSLDIVPIIGDVTNPEELPAFPNAETVLYAIGFDRSARHSMNDVYVEGLKNILTRLPDSVAHFIYISSTSVYGQQAGERIDENSPCKPILDNGKICFAAERCVEEFSRKKNSPKVTILRLAGIYGPGRLLRRIEDLKSGKKIAGNPDAFLNLIHIDDAVAAVLACELNAKNRCYLVSDNRPITRREYHELLANTLRTAPPQFEEEEEEEEEATLHRPNLNKRCCNARMKSELDFTLLFPTIAEGIPHAVREDESSR